MYIWHLQELKYNFKNVLILLQPIKRAFCPYIVQQNCCCFLYLHHTFRHLIPDHQTIYGRFPVFSSSPGQLHCNKQSPYECKPSHASQHTSVGAHLWCLNTQWKIEENDLENNFISLFIDIFANFEDISKSWMNLCCTKIWFSK